MEANGLTLDFVRFQVGDQILRVNGYPVEDAVHQEVALLAKNQQVLVLKIRSNYLAPVISLSQLPATYGARGGGDSPPPLRVSRDWRNN